VGVRLAADPQSVSVFEGYVRPASPVVVDRSQPAHRPAVGTRIQLLALEQPSEAADGGTDAQQTDAGPVAAHLTDDTDPRPPGPTM
jgi:hypothetical protein